MQIFQFISWQLTVIQRNTGLWIKQNFLQHWLNLTDEESVSDISINLTNILEDFISHSWDISDGTMDQAPVLTASLKMDSLSNIDRVYLLLKLISRTNKLRKLLEIIWDDKRIIDWLVTIPVTKRWNLWPLLVKFPMH